MKKLLTATVSLLLAIQSFAQLTYFNRTGRGFAIGGTYSHTSEMGYTINSYSGGIAVRFSRVLSASLEYMKTNLEWESYGFKASESALVPSITLQLPYDQLLGVAFHAGYADAKLVGGNPTLLLGLELYKGLIPMVFCSLYPVHRLARHLF